MNKKIIISFILTLFIIPSVYASIVTISIDVREPTVQQGDTVAMVCSYTVERPEDIVTLHWWYCEGIECEPTIDIPQNEGAGLGDTSANPEVNTTTTSITHLILGNEVGVYAIVCRGVDDGNVSKVTQRVVLNVTEGNFADVTNWSQFGGDVGHSGSIISFVPEYNKYDSDTLLHNITIGNGEYVEGNNIIVDNVLYSVSNNKVYSYNLNRSNGTKLWENSFSGDVFTGPAYSNSIVCHTESNNVTCLNANDGSLIWTYKEGGSLFFDINTPTISDGKLWIGSSSVSPTSQDVFVYSFNLTTGSIISKYTVPSQVTQKPQFATDVSISDNKVYVGSVGFQGNKGFLLVLNESEGTQLIANYTFNSSLGAAPWYNPPIVNGNNVYVALEDSVSSVNDPSFLLALNKNDLSLLWRANLTSGGQLFERVVPIVYNNKVIVASTDFSTSSFVYAFNNTDGSLIWTSVDLGTDIWNSPSVADGVAIIGDSTGTITALDVTDGTTLWTRNTDPIYSTPTIYNNDIFFGTENGKLFRLNSNDIFTDTNVQLLTTQDAVVDGRNKSGVLLNFSANSNANGTISIKKFLFNPKVSGTFGDSTLNKFIDIKDPDLLNQSMSQVEIRIYYNDEEVNNLGLNESSLAMEFFNETTGVTEPLPQTGVDIVNNFVWGITTHFSIFGGVGDLSDGDGDGIGDKRDNCPLVLNGNQEDFDGDGIGDVCDNCPFVSNGNLRDEDGDGKGDTCDSNILPRTLKNQTIKLIEDLRADCSSNECGIIINNSILHLEKTVETDIWWVDNINLSEMQGQKVFLEEEKTLINLISLYDPINEFIPKLKVLPIMLKMLEDADFNLASNEIQVANNTEVLNPNNQEDVEALIDEALDRMGNANKKLIEEDFVNSMKDLKIAWIKARDAKVLANEE